MAKFKFKNHIWIPHLRLSVSVPKDQEVYETEDRKTIEILSSNPQVEVEVVELKIKLEKVEAKVETSSEAEPKVEAETEERVEAETEEKVEVKQEPKKKSTRVRG